MNSKYYERLMWELENYQETPDEMERSPYSKLILFPRLLASDNDDYRKFHQGGTPFGYSEFGYTISGIQARDGSILIQKITKNSEPLPRHQEILKPDIRRRAPISRAAVTKPTSNVPDLPIRIPHPLPRPKKTDDNPGGKGSKNWIGLETDNGVDFIHIGKIEGFSRTAQGIRLWLPSGRFYDISSETVIQQIYSAIRAYEGTRSDK